jgi:drug/metabolite transporter (DMT)-like permease
MATKARAIVIMFFCTVFTAIGQLFYKLGANLLPAIFTNWQLFAGFASYGLGLALFLLALRGGEVSVLYPIISTSYIWTNILAVVFLAESISPLRWAGSFVIMIGISLIGIGGKKNGN